MTLTLLLLLACGQTATEANRATEPAEPAPSTDASDGERTISGEPTLAVGDDIQLCIREVENMAGVGSFRCETTIPASKTPAGPGLSELDLWNAVLAAGFAEEQVTRAVAYSFSAGDVPATALASSIELYSKDADPPESRALLNAYVHACAVDGQKDAPCLFVGVIGT